LSANNAYRLKLLALPENTAGAFYGLYDVLRSAGHLWAELMQIPDATPLFDLEVVSPNGEAFISHEGAPFAPASSFQTCGPAHIIVVGNVEIKYTSDITTEWAEPAEWLAKQYEQGAVICSVCSGSILLATAGLLDNAEATTHWAIRDLFGSAFPSVDLKPNRILLPTGDEHRIITAGGEASWEDLALYLIARFGGIEEAINVSKVFVLGDRSDGQLPYTAMAPARRHEDALIAKTQEWIADHYNVPNCVSEMTEQSGLARRTFTRRFKSATGYSPIDYVQALRIEEAKHLLETGDDPIDVVTLKVGYEEPAAFRRLFKSRVGTTPAKYRKRFQSIRAFK